ncbi:MAG: oligosaccharide repeat unit polymerase [Lachnospiraceae bacterium]|nr:oligosaccharide repeat unit polymerase [Lachnospiraceae bacterium]
MLPVTLVVLSLLFLLSFVIFDTDLLAPPTAVALVFLFGCFCTYYNEERWGLEFSPKSTGLIAAGIIATMVGGIIGVCLSRYPNLGKYSFSHEVVAPKEIIIHPFKTYLIIAFQLLALFLVFRHVQKVSGASGLLDSIGKYRLLSTDSSRDVNDPALKMSILTRNLAQASKMIGVVYAYIVGNNLIASKKKISLFWVPVILYSLTTFIQGDRSNMIRLWVVVLIVAYTIHKRAVGWRKNKSTRRMIRRMAISLVGLAALFSGIREFVGRTSDKDPLYYVTFYAGSPIAILDQLWTSPIVKPEVFGQRTFYYLNQSLTVLIGWPGNYNFYYDYMYSPTGVSIGNAPTAFRPAYVEFGFWGFFVLMALFGAFYTVLYCKSRKPCGDNPIDFRLLMYAYIAYVFLMYFYSTFFDFLSHLYIKYMVELLLIRWFLVGKKFKPNIRLFSRKTESVL